MQPPSLQAVGKTVWKDSTGLAIERLGQASFRLNFDPVACAMVDVEMRTVSLSAVDGELPASTSDHYLLDQLLPRIRSHEGELVVHAAVVRVGEGVVLITGPSGRGKSTLAASLDANGATLIGDDAAVLDVRDGRALASATYPSLRLLPDSLAALYGTARESSPTAHYTTKRRLVPTRASHDCLTPLPCLALFLLAEPTPPGEPIRLEQIEPRRACIELLRESFALDPSDTAQAAERLRQASSAAELIPAFELAYPRDYAMLPEVGKALIAAAKG